MGRYIFTRPINVGAQDIGIQGHKFLEEVLKHANTASKFSETAVICALDMCKVAWRVTPEGEVPLRVIGMDIAHEIKVGSLRVYIFFIDSYCL